MSSKRKNLENPCIYIMVIYHLLLSNNSVAPRASLKEKSEGLKKGLDSRRDRGLLQLVIIAFCASPTSWLLRSIISSESIRPAVGKNRHYLLQTSLTRPFIERQTNQGGKDEELMLEVRALLEEHSGLWSTPFYLGSAVSHCPFIHKGLST